MSTAVADDEAKSDEKLGCRACHAFNTNPRYSTERGSASPHAGYNCALHLGWQIARTSDLGVDDV